DVGEGEHRAPICCSKSVFSMPGAHKSHKPFLNIAGASSRCVFEIGRFWPGVPSVLRERAIGYCSTRLCCGQRQSSLREESEFHLGSWGHPASKGLQTHYGGRSKSGLLVLFAPIWASSPK